MNSAGRPFESERDETFIIALELKAFVLNDLVVDMTYLIGALKYEAAVELGCSKCNISSPQCTTLLDLHDNLVRCGLLSV